jgi:23S rRNA pseudouridine2605 synthase
MPKPNSNGPRRRKSDDKPQGARPGGRTRENRADSSGSRRSAPFKKGRPKPGLSADRSEKPPRRSSRPADGESRGTSGYKAKSFGSRRPSGEGREDRGTRAGGRPGFGRPRSNDADESSRFKGKSFGSKRPPRSEGSGESPRFNKSFGTKRPSRPAGSDESPGFKGKSFGGKRPPRAEGEEGGEARKSGFGSRSPRADKRADFDKPERANRGGERGGFGRERKGARSEEGDRPKKFSRDNNDRSTPRHDSEKSFGGTDHGHQAASNRPFKKFDRGGVKRGGQSVRQEPELPAPASTGGPMRLNKFIANSGVCSRREADELITMGLISINGKVVTTLGHKVNPGDEVRHENRVLRAEKPVYILMNKPKGFLTTTSDPEERSTVMNLVGNFIKERIYPVGRLDRNTTGLLVLTNDGDLAEKLMHPSHNMKKIYRVDLDRPLTKADATKIMEGIQLEEGKAIVDDLAIVSEDKKTVGLEIHIGWNRVVRRIFEALEYQVVKLDRTMYAGLTKKDLPRGEWRFLTKDEVVLLKHYK